MLNFDDFDDIFGKISVLTVWLMSQAAACDGTTVTTSAVDQEFVPGTLPIY